MHLLDHKALPTTLAHLELSACALVRIVEDLSTDELLKLESDGKLSNTWVGVDMDQHVWPLTNGTKAVRRFRCWRTSARP